MAAAATAMVRLALVLAAALLLLTPGLADAHYNVTLFGCDRNGRGPPTVTGKRFTSDAGELVKFPVPLVTMQVAYQRAYTFTSDRDAAASQTGGIRIHDCRTDGSGCTGYSVFIPNTKVTQVLRTSAAWRAYVFVGVQYTQRASPSSAVDAVVRCDRRNLTDCQIINFEKALNPNASSNLPTANLMTIVNNRIFVSSYTFGPPNQYTPVAPVISCALTLNSPTDSVISDCRIVPTTFPNFEINATPGLTADADNLFGTFSHEEDIQSCDYDFYNCIRLVPTVIRCPFASLSLLAPSCKAAELPPLPVVAGSTTNSYPGESVVYKGYHLQAARTFTYKNSARDVIELNAFINTCGGEPFKCVRYDNLGSFFGIPPLVDILNSNGFSVLQLKVTSLGVFLWSFYEGTGQQQGKRFILTECRLPVSSPASWFKPATCRSFDVVTLANIAQDFYHRVGYVTASELFFDERSSKFVATLSVRSAQYLPGDGFGTEEPFVYMLNAGPPCKKLNAGCGRKTTTCAALNYTCGTGLDECGRALECGDCGYPLSITPTKIPFCSADGVLNQCGCVADENHDCYFACYDRDCSNPTAIARDACGKVCTCGDLGCK